MSYTHNEFISNFSAVANGLSCQIHSQHIELNDGTGRIVIELGDEQSRKLGSLAIPTMTVTFKFYNYTESARDEFIQRFDLYYHKGGG